MAPEQRSQAPVTPATDIWDLGLVAFFLLTVDTGRVRISEDFNSPLPDDLTVLLASLPTLRASC
jgi:serine/threonine protein kinase